MEEDVKIFFSILQKNGNAPGQKDDSGNVIAAYYYDPFGRRLWKNTGSGRTYYLYSDEGLVGEYDSSGTEIKTYGYAMGSQWGTNPLFQKVGTIYYWYHNDHQGTPQKITDTTGTVVWSATYDSFGKTTIGTETITNNLRFPGQYYDTETGLHYNWNRYYDPETGRYMRVDPIGEGLNLYLYTQNNPLKYIDPRGLNTSRVGSFSDGGNDYTYDYTPNPNVSLTSRNQEVPGFSNNSLSLTPRNREVPGLESAPEWIDKGQNVSNSSGLAKKIIKEAVSWAPVVGPAIDSYNYFKEGDYVRGGISAAFAVADAIPFVAGITKGIKAVSKITKISKGLSARGYRPATGERTIQGYVDDFIQEAGGGSPTVQRGGRDLFRVRSGGHGQPGTSVTPQNVRNVAPNKVYYGKGDDVPTGTQHIKEIYKARDTGNWRTRGGR